MRKPTVHLYTVCWDEADMLGFFFRHYDPWVDRYVVYDDGSTDGSTEILRAHPKVELRRFERTHAESFVLSHKQMQDEAWKESRGRADWICITAIDEHLHAGAQPMSVVLAGAQRAGVTLLPALGFDMNHPDMPGDEGLLVERVTQGRPRIAFNKLSLFRPDFIRETGFGPGRHAADPSGDLVLPPSDTVMLWHYKHLGFERNAAREAAQKERLGRVDVERDFGQHYRWTKERLRGFWDEMERESRDLSAPDFVAERDAVRPLWWEERPTIRRQSTRPSSPVAVGSAPTVSVLVKAYNHASYVGRTIESVLEQSFQDFEIVVTDDGSTDDTAATVARYDDPRIRLDVLPENCGISSAMNATIARARGRYLAILNSDDWALPERLATQVAFLDSRPDVALVFGMPEPVDEQGRPTQSFFDFTEALRLPDFTPDTWLRRFFDHSNCLCAPTAMVRAEAYRAAGSYDPRFTNLQDFDMWVRMSLAGQAIHVLPQALTAFRIRDGAANMSAPRPDTLLRHHFEQSSILCRFAELSPERFEGVFGKRVTATSELPMPLRVAELALRDPSPSHQNAALRLYFDHARRRQDFDRLRDLAGSTDIFGLLVPATRERRIAELETHIAHLEAEHAAGILARDARVAELENAVSDLTTKSTVQESEKRHLQEALHVALTSRERMRASLSWRSTAPLRWIGRRVKAARRLGR